MRNVILALSFAAAVCSVLVLLFYIRKLVLAAMKKTDCTQKCCVTDDCMNYLDEIIKTNVAALNQTIVNKLKSDGEFTQLEREEVFELCREKVFQTVDENKMNNLCMCMGNMDEWINSRIEYHVYMLKN